MTLGDKVVVMREGRVHQIGTPETIYNRPADTFVATFVGSPMMNLFEGQVIREGDYPRFRCTDFSLDVRNLAQDLVGKTVEIGVRPEDIEFGKKGKANLRARVEMLSNVGAEKYVHARLGENAITVRASKDATYSTVTDDFSFY